MFKEKKIILNKSIKIVIFSLFFTFINAEANNRNTIPFEELNKFSQIYNILKNNYIEDISGSELINNAIKGMVDNLDSHSKYLIESESNFLKESINGEFAGIGVEVKEVENGLLIISPFDNSPAIKEDLRTDDIIVKIEESYVSDLKNIDEAIQLLRGKEGTKVSITIKRDKIYLDKILTREKIQLESVTSKIYEENYAYIRISLFQEKTSQRLRNEILNINQKNKSIKGYILDLRNNPGGLLNSAIEVVDHFIDGKETAVSIKSRKNSEVFYYTKNGDITNGKPIIILINKGSASSSEIVAGALQDLNRAIIIGNNSFGKGSVQEIINFRDNTSIKYTSARYYTPKGRDIEKEGIIPDIVVNNDLNNENNSDYFIKKAIETFKIINHPIKNN